MNCLKFQPFSSAIDTAFWHELTRRKLDVYRLDSSNKTIHGFYSNDGNDRMPALFNVDQKSFERDENCENCSKTFRVEGTLKLLNTIEEMKSFDTDGALKSESQTLWNDFVRGDALDNPERTNRFFLLVFADLKKYFFTFWFAFPTFLVPKSFELNSPVQSIGQRFSSEKIDSLIKIFDSDRAHATSLLENDDQTFSLLSLREAVQKLNEDPQISSKIFFVVKDPSSDPLHPAWPIRNFLILIFLHLTSAEKINVICWRERFRDGRRQVDHSLSFEVKVESLRAEIGSMPECSGWEKNDRQRFGPRQVNLSTSMDPVHLAETAVGLNLKLMKWRLAPELNLQDLESLRVLLFGAGTLGCNVARCLMGWGVKNITFVDNARISFSNPVRQTLFTFDDSRENKIKSKAAADALKTIYPGMKSEGHCLTIPMPGHAVGESTAEKVKADVQYLHELIRDHDAVFLLTDSRESRWLPTVIAGIERKIVICCAVGFDSYVIIRHGVPDEQIETSTSATDSTTKFLYGNKLGCYFCNDVVAPGDSSIDRTLDQQCTVTRPGISMIASALAVELLVSIIQHPLRSRCPALIRPDLEDSYPEVLSCLGLVPHTIRGFLGRHSTVLPTGEAFNQCVACSTIVRQAYQRDGFAFLMKVFNEVNYLEDLTGLRAMQLATDLNEIIELSDDEEI